MKEGNIIVSKVSKHLIYTEIFWSLLILIIATIYSSIFGIIVGVVLLYDSYIISLNYIKLDLDNSKIDIKEYGFFSSSLKTIPLYNIDSVEIGKNILDDLFNSSMMIIWSRSSESKYTWYEKSSLKGISNCILYYKGLGKKD